MAGDSETAAALMGPLASRIVGVPLTAAYVIHGAANPLHQTLLHHEVDGPYRATVLSLSSLMAQPDLILGSLVLTALADATSITAAMVVGAVVMASAAPLYLVSRRAPEPSPAIPRADHHEGRSHRAEHGAHGRVS